MEQVLREAKTLETQISALVREQKWQTALDACIKAVDAYMKARSQAPGPQQQKAMSEKCRAMIQTGERIKKLRDGKTSSTIRDEEVQKIMESLGNMSLSPGSASETATKTTKTTRGGALSSEKPSKTTNITTFQPPSSKRPLSRKEEMLLWKSSKLGPHKFPPWEGDPSDDMFKLNSPAELFTDVNGMLTLSELQLKVFENWRRASEIWKGEETMELTQNAKKNVDLTQDVVTDCSVVASLCSALEREMRGIGSVFKSNIWPQRHGEPVVSPNGKYIVKLWFNGCYRKVIIDDFLPTAVAESGNLFVTSDSHPAYILPVILEKAYLKAMGGYDFPGSNSGTDLLCLTGWIPEHLFLQPQDSDYGCEIVDQDHLWSKVFTSWGYGDVLVTLGTGNFVGGGLVAEHDYSVIGMKEFTNHRGMLERWWLVKNPWKVGGVWKGLPHDDSSSDEDEDFDAPPDPKRSIMRNEIRAAELPEPPSKSAFWIDLANVFRYFQSIYLNWNPALWRFRYDWHFVWEQKAPPIPFPSPSHGPPSYLWSAPGCFWANPQYLVRNKSNSEATTWILLSRHLVSASESEADSSRCGWIRSGYISLYLFAADGRRVFQSSGMLKRGLYVNSPQTLLRFKIPAKTTYTVVVSSQDLIPVDAAHTFSLTAFSEAPLDFEPVSEPYPHTVSLASAWTSRTAGGRKESKTYENNPMFKLTLDADSSDVMLALSVLQSDHHHRSEDEHRVETKKADAANSTPSPAIHVSLLHSSGGKRVYAITRKQILADSGDYRRHFTLCKATAVPRGSYTIVASTFQPNMLSPFLLTVGVSTPLQRNAVLQLGSEDSGRLKKVIEGQWGLHKKVSRKITAGRLTSVSLKFVDTADNLVRVGVWEQDMMRWTAGGWNEDDDDQEDFVEGVVRLGDFDLRPEKEVGGTYIVAERMVSEDQRDGKGNEPGGGKFQLTMLSDNVIEDDPKGGWVGDADD